MRNEGALYKAQFETIRAVHWINELECNSVLLNSAYIRPSPPVGRQALLPLSRSDEE